MRSLWPERALRVPRLRRGDRVAVIALSSGLAPLFPGVYERGLESLRALGLEPVELPTARMKSEELYEHPDLRARDLRDALVRDDVQGVVSVIGGYESIRLYPLLRSRWFREHPKPILGGSDATTYLLFARRAGVVGLYGPSVMAGFSQMDDLPGARGHLEEFLFSEWERYEYSPFPKFTHGYTGWGGADRGGIQPLHEHDGWVFLQGETPVTGELFGGCIEVVEFLKGTPFWPPPGFFNHTILFFETSEEKPPPARVGYMLRNYGVAGILGRVSAILFGRPKDYTAAESQQLNELVATIVSREFGRPDMPIVMNVDFGHTDPKLLMPLGGRVRVDPVARTISLVESPFTNLRRPE